MQSLEDMARDLQVKVIQLQEENAILQEKVTKCQKNAPSVTETEAWENMKLKVKVTLELI